MLNRSYKNWMFLLRCLGRGNSDNVCNNSVIFTSEIKYHNETLYGVVGLKWFNKFKRGRISRTWSDLNSSFIILLTKQHYVYLIYLEFFLSIRKYYCFHSTLNYRLNIHQTKTTLNFNVTFFILICNNNSFIIQTSFYTQMFTKW